MSLRMLFFLMTLLCSYLACWGPTKRQGVIDVRHSLEVASLGAFRGPSYSDAVAALPLIVGIDRHYPVFAFGTERVYVFWLFGYTTELPFRYCYKKNWELGTRHMSERSFRGLNRLRTGMSRFEVRSILRQPSEIHTCDNWQIWHYEDGRIRLSFAPEGGLTSIGFY